MQKHISIKSKWCWVVCFHPCVEETWDNQRMFVNESDVWHYSFFSVTLIMTAPNCSSSRCSFCTHSWFSAEGNVPLTSCSLSKHYEINDRTAWQSVRTSAVSNGHYGAGYKIIWIRSNSKHPLKISAPTIQDAPVLVKLMGFLQMQIK